MGAIVLGKRRDKNTKQKTGERQDEWRERRWYECGIYT